MRTGEKRAAVFHFEYYQTAQAANLVRTWARIGRRGTTKVAIAGHSLGGTSAVALSNRIAGVAGISIEGLYLIDAVGKAPTSNPNSQLALGVLATQGRLDDDNPEQINSHVRSVGLFYQRNGFPYGISVTYGAPLAFSPYAAHSATHTDLDEASNPDGMVVHTRILAHARAVLRP